ncbi:hypothetical protein N8371_08885 [Vicingaceae bacterium]|nr:hypothetical protein [Vicingaceae bacterium]
MKKYNVENYIRYKDDIKLSMPEDKPYVAYTKDELIIKFLPLVENLARKFASSEQAIGIMSIDDLLQIGSEGLVKACNKLDFIKLQQSEDVDKTIKSFLSKRIRGAIRRQIDINVGSMRIPEAKRNTMRKNPDNKELVQLFFNSIFLSIDNMPSNDDGDTMYQQIGDKSEPYNIALLNAYLKGIMTKHLSELEYEVLRLSYGLDCDKHSGLEIAEALNIQGVSRHVRVSELKKQAVDTLIENVDSNQVIDYL